MVERESTSASKEGVDVSLSEVTGRISRELELAGLGRGEKLADSCAIYVPHVVICDRPTEEVMKDAGLEEFPLICVVGRDQQVAKGAVRINYSNRELMHLSVDGLPGLITLPLPKKNIYSDCAWIDLSRFRRQRQVDLDIKDDFLFLGEGWRGKGMEGLLLLVARPGGGVYVGDVTLPKGWRRFIQDGKLVDIEQKPLSEQQVYQPSKWEVKLADLMKKSPETIFQGLEYFARRLPRVDDSESIIGLYTGKRRAILGRQKTPVEIEVGLTRARMALDNLSTEPLVNRWLDGALLGPAIVECLRPGVLKDLVEHLILEMKAEGLQRGLALTAKIIRGKTEVIYPPVVKSLIREIAKPETFAYLLCQLKPEKSRHYHDSRDSGQRPAIFENSRPPVDRFGFYKKEVVPNPLSVALEAEERKKEEGTSSGERRVHLRWGVDLVIREKPGQSEPPREQSSVVVPDESRERTHLGKMSVRRRRAKRVAQRRGNRRSNKKR